MATTRGYLGIDNGTQGLSIILIDEESFQVIASGETYYDMVENLPPGCYEQHSQDWEDAMVEAMKQVKETVQSKGGGELQVLAIGISGEHDTWGGNNQLPPTRLLQ